MVHFEMPPVEGPARLIVDTCGLINSGDSALAMFAGTNQLGNNDDACGLDSKIVWVIPSRDWWRDGYSSNPILDGHMTTFVDDTCVTGKIRVTLGEYPDPLIPP